MHPHDDHAPGCRESRYFEFAKLSGAPLQKYYPDRFSLQVIIYFSKKFDGYYHPGCFPTPQKWVVLYK